MVYNRIFGAIFLQDPGIKFVPGIGNWLARRFLIASTNFQTRAYPPQDTRTCPRELVFKSPRCSLGVLLGATTTSRHRGSRRIPYENAQNPSEEHDSMHAPARIPSDPVRIPSHKMHQTQAKIIIHDIAPPRIPSDPASDPVSFAGS